MCVACYCSFVLTCVLIFVPVGPEISITSDHNVAEAGKIEFKCTATGTPTPTVVWKIRDEKIADQQVRFIK